MPERFTALFNLLGGLGGSLVALSIITPKNRLDALARIISSIIISYFLTYPTSQLLATKLGINITFQTEAAVAMLLGLFGWFVISIALRTLASSKTIKDLRSKIE